MAKKRKNTKVVSWKDKLSIKTITQNINDVHDLYTDYVHKVGCYKRAMEASYKLPSGDGKSKVTPKAIKKLHNYAYAELSESLLSDYDVISASPRGNQDHDSAAAQELLINYQVNEEMDFDSVVDKAARYFEDYGSFYLKLAWNYKEKKVKNNNPTLQQLPDGIPPEQLQQLQAQGLLTPEGLLIVDKEIDEVVDDHPIISIKKYNQIILGASTDGSNSIDSLQFIADRSYSTINALEATGKYNNLDKIRDRDIESDYNLNALPDAEFEAEFERIMEDAENVKNTKGIDKDKALVVTEYWTKTRTSKNTISTVVVTIAGGVIIGSDKSPLPDGVGYPFARGLYSPSLDDELYDGIPDTLDLEEDQKIIGAVTRGLIDIMGRSANGQTGMAHGMLDPAEERKRQIGQDYKFNPAIDPARGIVQEKFPELPQSGLQMLSLMQNSMESTSGKKMFGEGLNSNAYGDVAAGVKATTDKTTQRTLSSVRRFNKPFVEIFKKLAQVNKEFITDDKIIVLSDKTYKTVRNDDLQSRINIKIEVSTPETQNQQASEMGFIMQTLGNTVDDKTKKLILADIATLKKRPDLAEAIRNIPEPQPSPQEVEIQQLEIELLKAKIANEYAKATENNTDATLNEAKAVTEQSKANLLESNKDNQDLDFLHRRNGVAESREKSRISLQHSNDIEKALLGDMITKKQGEDNNEVKSKVPNKTNDAKIPVIDTPRESLQPSDLIK